MVRRFFSRVRSTKPTRPGGRQEICGREVMRRIANHLVTTSLVVVAAFAVMPVQAADVDARSTVDAVTVYPDGASVTRVITADLATGRQYPGGNRFPVDAGSVLASGRGRGGGKTHHRRHRYTAAACRAAGQSAGTRQAHRSAEGRARQSLRRDQCGHRAPQICRAVCGKLARGARREGRGASDRRVARGLCRGRGGSGKRGHRDP